MSLVRVCVGVFGCCGKAGSTLDDEDADRSKRKEQGYTVAAAVNDWLVPAEGYACRKPHHNRKRENELKKEMRELNEKMSRDLKRAMAKKSGDIDLPVGGSDEKKKDKKGPPHEAICKIRLTSAEPSKQQVGQAFDFMQESSLEVTVKGSLHFPPDAPPKELRPKDEQDGRTDPLDHRWNLEFDVLVKLMRFSGNGDQDDADKPALKVQAVSLDIHKELMVDSWLSKDEVLQDIELLLETKLKMSLGNGSVDS